MTVSKTKAKLVDVARQLFAKMGVENTTMNDIALASKKGRRTLYTYFKSKDEIYLAVVESELDISVGYDEAGSREKHFTGREIAGADIYPIRRGEGGGLSERDVACLLSSVIYGGWRRCVRSFDAKEVQFFKAVLLEGQAKGVFHIDDVEMTADLIHYCVKGIEVPYIRGHIGAHLDEDTRNRYVSNIVFGALHRTEI